MGSLWEEKPKWRVNFKATLLSQDDPFGGIVGNLEWI